MIELDFQRSYGTVFGATAEEKYLQDGGRFYADGKCFKIVKSGDKNE